MEWGNPKQKEYSRPSPDKKATWWISFKLNFEHNFHAPININPESRDTISLFIWPQE